MKNKLLGLKTFGFASAGVLATLSSAHAQSTANVLLPHDLSPWGMFMNADIVVKAVMIGLAFASLVTWTVCAAKMIELRGETVRAKRRMRTLDADQSLAHAARDNADGRDAVARIVQAAAREAQLSGGVFDDGLKERITLRLERVEAAMSRRIARGTGVLATIGATAPFVGLFGTVWGIMNSFIGLSQVQQATLSTVAPGIAEALIATAIGLFAAIPAVIAYNRFAARGQTLLTRYYAFGNELQVRLHRTLRGTSINLAVAA